MSYSNYFFIVYQNKNTGAIKKTEHSVQQNTLIFEACLIEVLKGNSTLIKN